MTAIVRAFGVTRDGHPVEAIDLTGGGLTATVLTYGATLSDVRLDRAGWPMTLGAPALAAYEGGLAFAGAICGPVANRISGAAFRLDGDEFRIDANEGGRTTLHGGRTGTHGRVWRLAETGEGSVTLTLDLPAGFGGFPGNRRLTAHFALTAQGRLALDLTATTDAPTVMNLANHSYWNLDGAPTTAGHRLTIAADHYLPVDADLIPAGEVDPVDGTAFDFRTGRTLHDVAAYDHCLCLGRERRAPRAAAILQGRRGVRMTLSTTEPGLQVYDGRGLGGVPVKGHGDRAVLPFAGIALEAQGWPDAPNRPDFPSVRLDPGTTYRQTTIFDFALV